jgi:hypothetical protein
MIWAFGLIAVLALIGLGVPIAFAMAAVGMAGIAIIIGIDPMWASHEPWLVPEPFTPEPGEMYGKEALDTWIPVLARISDEAYSDPEIVKTAPHNQAVHRLDHDAMEDPARWAMTWRASNSSARRLPMASSGSWRDWARSLRLVLINSACCSTMAM